METLMEQGIKPYMPQIIVTVLVVILTLWLMKTGMAKLIQLGQRWAGYEEGHYFFQPKTWFKIEPKAHFLIKGEILANKELREIYAPASHFIRDLREKERAWKLAWLSPFPQAVKASIAAENIPKTKKLDARKQIKEIAKNIEVRHLPETIAVANGLRKKDAPEGESEEAKAKRIKKQCLINDANHIQINLATVGKDPAVIERIENNLLTQLDLKGGIRQLKTPDPTVISYIAHKLEAIDPLTDAIGIEYLDEHKAKFIFDIVIGIDSAGKPVRFKVHHTMILGASGSGKGSPLQSIIWQLAPFVKKGIVEFNAIDPKRAEFALFAKFPSRLFNKITLGSSDDDMRDHAELISYILNVINQRALNAPLCIDEGEVVDGRDFDASVENPMLMFFIDEFPSLFQGFKKLGRDGATPIA